MNNTLIYALFGTIAGVFGTGIGAMLAFATKKSSNKFLASILEYSSGLMISIVLLDLLPEAFNHAGLFIIIISIIAGLGLMFFAEKIVSIKLVGYKQMGVVMALGIGVHNFPEGLAIGAGFDTSFVLGLSLAITILLHDVPEGIAMAIPLKLGGSTIHRSVFIAMASGLPMGFGALIGAYVGNISQNMIAVCLAFASGAMMYIVLNNLIPESKNLYKGRLSSLFNFLGIVTGIIVSYGL